MPAPNTPLTEALNSYFGNALYTAAHKDPQIQAQSTGGAEDVFATAFSTTVCKGDSETPPDNNQGWSKDQRANLQPDWHWGSEAQNSIEHEDYQINDSLYSAPRPVDWHMRRSTQDYIQPSTMLHTRSTSSPLGQNIDYTTGLSNTHKSLYNIQEPLSQNPELPKSEPKKKVRNRKRSKALISAEAEIESRDKFLSRNRFAAKKCRGKKKEELQELQEEFERQSVASKALENRFNATMNEVTMLRSEMARHAHCGLIGVSANGELILEGNMSFEEDATARIEIEEGNAYH